MTETQGFAFPALRPKVGIATAQQGIACWSRAMTQIADGMMSAGVAQIELGRALCAPDMLDWRRMLQPASPAEAAEQFMHGTRTRFDTALQGCRHINNVLAGSFFAVAASLVEGLAPEAPASRPPKPERQPRAEPIRQSA